MISSFRPVENRRQLSLGYCHSHRVTHALTEWAGCGLNAGGVAEFGMPRRAALPLAEMLDVIEGQVVATEVEKAVKQHRRMSGREHEAVAICPVGIFRVVFQVACPQHVGQRGKGHRCAWVSRSRLSALHPLRALEWHRCRAGQGTVRVSVRSSLYLKFHGEDTPFPLMHQARDAYWRASSGNIPGSGRVYYSPSASSELGRGAPPSPP